MKSIEQWVVTVKGSDEGIGSVGPWYPANWPEKELGWTLWDAAYEGHGYITEAAAETRRHVFQNLGWGSAVSYIAHGNDRMEAIARLRRALDQFVIQGIDTSLDLHREILRDPDFVRGEMSTGFMERFLKSRS